MKNIKNSKHYSKASSRIAQRRKVRAMAKRLFQVVLALVIFVGTGFLSRADFMQIKSFEISGAENVSQENIKSFVSNFASGTKLFFIPKSNIVLFNKDNLSSALLSKFKEIEKVKINKNFLSGEVSLYIVERKGEFLWCAEDGTCFNMTKDGLVFENSAYLGGKIIFRGILIGDPTMKNFATPETMKAYLDFIGALKMGDLSVFSISIESSDKAVAETNIGDIYFTPDAKDLSVVAENVILLIKEIKSKNSSSTFQYIDARFGNKIFYK